MEKIKIGDGGNSEPKAKEMENEAHEDQEREDEDRNDDPFKDLPKIQSQMFPSPVTFSGIHAKCTAQERQVLWADLLRDKPASAPWFLVGDFNVIISEREKRGGLPFRTREGVDFLQFMAEAGVSDVSFSGSRFTWCNNRPGTARIWKRLDRLLVNGAALHLQHQVAVQHLGRDPSDHSPLLLSVVTRLDDKPRPFRFLNFWTMHKGFLDIIRDC
ncbi:uncharacterized protein [Coffea arabica]|uniref:Endonuclease/exonuclease/phosphatase domain-containing protein n=1 Tax=Coffea arabica TaxID=13443 RepID=A0ABM4U205_COFAR